ncbi:MAG: 2Fe-2S iron-sulfur cluster-binding protein [Candidatus Aminicenantes bacterium]|nr:2Fe-2S iron-sulfur cluster-binding protein [Candidatus Aminicenantes bacterium]
MITIQLDGRALQVPPGTTVLKAAEQAGIVIPRFCYHPAFEPEGSCRMCLVEIEGLPKLDLACSTVVREGMKVWTSTPKVIQARKDVLEFFLADHPLDCPICDKAGECKLQEYYDRHGLFAGRFVEAKEKRDKKVAIGKGLLLDRERCILCTLCVRFLRKVTGTGELGVFERAVRAEIGTYDGVPVDNNYSGNLVDICPVGAITDADFRFKMRAWFLIKGPTVCPISRGRQVRGRFSGSGRGRTLPSTAIGCVISAGPGAATSTREDMCGS